MVIFPMVERESKQNGLKDILVNTIFTMLFLLLFATCIECKRSDNDVKWPERNELPKRIEVQEESQSVFVQDIFRQKRYVNLRSFEDGIIGSVDKVIIHNDKIFALDRTITKSIYVFDLFGSHLFTIGKKGGGPGEFSVVEDFDLTDSGDIYIYDSGNGRLSLFSNEGDFIKEDRRLRTRQIIPDAIAILNDAIVVNSQADCYSGRCYSLVMLNNEEIVTEDVPNNHLNSFHVEFGKNFSRFDNEVFMSQIFNDTIYNLNIDGEVKTKYFIDFKRSEQDKRLIKSSIEDDENGIIQLLSSNMTIGVVDIFVNNSHVWLKYLSNNQKQNLLFSREGDGVVNFNRMLFETGEFPFSQLVGSTEDEFIFYISSESISNSNIDVNTSLEEVFTDYDLNNNGVLVFVTLNSDLSK